MAKEPGNLNDLNSAGKQEWADELARMHATAIRDAGTRHFVAQPTAAMTQPPDVVDWSGMPVRVQTCLRSRSKAMRLSDWVTGTGDRGRSICHEEYMEWRTVRNAAGKIVRVEITTEVQEYWVTLARHDPVKLLSIIERFAREPVPVQAVYGNVNPNGVGVTPDDRESGFRSMMMPAGRLTPPRSPYNNGQKAICFLYQPVNAFEAAVQLAAFAGFPLAASTAAGTRPLTGAEAIALGNQNAVDCRNSDPTIVGGVIGQAFQGRQIAFDDPAGVYITHVDTPRLRRPDDQSSVPENWFNLQRGIPSEDGKPRTQRLVLEVPPDLPFEVGDLVDSQTGEDIRFGWQVAQLVTVGLYVRVGGTVPGGPQVEALQPTADCANQRSCQVFSRAFEEMEPTTPQPLAARAVDEGVRRPSRKQEDFE